MRRPWALALGGAVIALVATGCAQNEDLIKQLQKDKLDLQSQIGALQGRVADMARERDLAMARARELEQHIRALQDRLAEPVVVKLPEGFVQAGPFMWTTLDADFLFDAGKATLRSAAREKLQEVVTQIQTEPEFQDKFVWVLGHTDSDPIKISKHLWEDNLDLSANRAMTVYRELMKLGISPNRMIAAGQGEYFERVPNTSAANRQQNRRVEIILTVPRPAVGETGATAPVDHMTASPTVERTTRPPAEPPAPPTGPVRRTYEPPRDSIND